MGAHRRPEKHLTFIPSQLQNSHRKSSGRVQKKKGGKKAATETQERRKKKIYETDRDRWRLVGGCGVWMEA